MLWLTEDAKLICDHRLGAVQNEPTQDFVTIDRRRVLVQPNPVGKTIKGCPNVGAMIKPCATTLPVKKGYSGFLRVQGHRVCLDTVTGLTDGTPPGTVFYTVNEPGQPFVSEL